MRERPQDAGVLKVLERRLYENIDKGLLFGVICNNSLFSQDQLNYNKALLVKFYSALDRLYQAHVPEQQFTDAQVRDNQEDGE